MKPTNAMTLSTQIRRVGTPVLACAQRGANARTKATVSPSIQQTNVSASPRLTLNNSIQTVHHSPARVKLVVEPQNLTLELQRPGLTVVEVQSASYKQEGDADEVELHWKRDVKAREAEQRKASMKVEAAVQRAAEECLDVRFLQVKVPDAGPGRKALISLLSLYALPAVQFYRDGQHMWEQQGQPGLERALGAGLLYFTGRGAGGEKLDDEDVVKHLNSVSQLNTWLENGQPGTVQVLFVSESSGPCIRVNPAFVALARNFTSGPQPVQFGRLNLDALGHNQEAKDLVQRLNLVTAPTFMFFVQGQEQRRYVGSTAADLMGHILEAVQALPAPELQQQQQHLEPAVAAAQTDEAGVPAPATSPVVASIQESMARLLAAFAAIKATFAAAVGASEPMPTPAVETAPAGTVTAASIQESATALLAATAAVKAALEAGAAPAGSAATAAERVAGSGHDSTREESLVVAEAVEEVESVVNVCA